MYATLFFVLIGLLLSATQILGESPDYSQYDEFFALIRNEGLDALVESRFEPGFSIFAFFLTTLSSVNIVVYSGIVVAAMLLKGWAISAYSASLNIFIITALFYFARYFPLHELTQLRAACAIALILSGAVFLWKGNLVIGALLCALSLLFHMSAAAVIPALLLVVSQRSRVILIACVIFIFTSAFSGILTGYLGNFISMVDSYQTSGFGKDLPNPFAVQLLIDWTMIAISLVMWDRLSLLMKRIVLLELIGMGVFYGVNEFAVVAHRIREFYSVFWVLFVADGLRQKDTKLLIYGFVLTCIIFYFYIFVFSKNFFNLNI